MAAGQDPEVEAKAVALAGELLRSAAGAVIRGGVSEALTAERSVWRCYLEGGDGLPDSVIVRTSRELGGWRTDPVYLLNDYAAVTFLSSCRPRIAPRVIAADLAVGVYVTEDLGPGPSLGDLLSGPNQMTAADGLVAFARVLGQMHAQTAGRDGEYRSRRDRLGPVDHAAHRITLNEASLPAASEMLLAAAAGHGAPGSRLAVAELHGVLRDLSEPRGFLALTNGDPCPYNCLASGSAGARLIDFELACYRHALLDAAYLHLGFHCCYRPGRIPAAPLDQAEAAYRAEASAGIPAVLDDSAYFKGLAAAASAWAVLTGLTALRHRDSHEPGAQDRVTRACAAMNAYVALCRQRSQLPALADWIAGITKALGNETAGQAVYRPFL